MNNPPTPWKTPLPRAKRRARAALFHSPRFAGFDSYSCDCASLLSGVTLSIRTKIWSM